MPVSTMPEHVVWEIVVLRSAETVSGKYVTDRPCGKF